MLWPSYTWRMPPGERNLYLTFDDGPHPVATPFVLDLLQQYNAKASFFCIGKNVRQYPALYQRILDEGHAVGNHTAQHVNGWKTDDEKYIADVQEAATVINSKLFRPPYGRIRQSQARKLPGYKIIMWDVLSADFDTSLEGEDCFRIVTKKAGAGSIIVFHDSEKALPRLQYALPLAMAYWQEAGYHFSKL